MRQRPPQQGGQARGPCDLIVIRFDQVVADFDQRVVALVGDDATVKRLKVDGGVPVLMPENPAFEPIRPDSGQEMRLLGKVVEVRRYFEETPPWLS